MMSDHLCNFVKIHMKREFGLKPHFRNPENEFLMLAEDKAALCDTDDISCSLPGNPRSTFLMTFSPDGTKIASTHGDHKIYISDVKTGHCIHTLEGHPRTPWCIAFHPSSNEILASGCLGGEVRVWDLHGGSEIWVAEQNSVIASLAFHPCDQVLVIATYNEIFFWDWNKPQPFASCKTSSEREKVRYVKFDCLGLRLITGIANLPTVQSNRTEGCRATSLRNMTARFVSPVEQVTRLMEFRREFQRQQAPTSQTSVGTDPVATSERPTSPTQIEALDSARAYAQEITSQTFHFPEVSSSQSNDTLPSVEDIERNGWRYRDPYSLRDRQTSNSNVGVHFSNINNSQSNSRDLQNREDRLRASTSVPRTESSLPSSLVQVLVRLQRSIEILSQTRLNAAMDQSGNEQVHLRQRIEEILSRLFNLYASISPLRMLMDEVFQDIDREAMLIASGGQNSLSTTQEGLDLQLQELRQQLARLLERIFVSESGRQQDTNSRTSESRQPLPDSQTPVSLSISAEFTSTPTVSSHYTPESSSSSSGRSYRSAFVPNPNAPFTPYLPIHCGRSNSSILNRRQSDSQQINRMFANSRNNNESLNSVPSQSTYGTDRINSRLSEHSTSVFERDPRISAAISLLNSESAQTLQPSDQNNTSNRTCTSSLGANRTINRTSVSSEQNSTNNRPGRTGITISIPIIVLQEQPLVQEENPSRRLSPVPQVRIDHVDNDERVPRPPSRMRPRSPPLSSVLQRQQRQSFVDYQAAASSSNNDTGGGRASSSYLHPNYVASLFDENLQRTNTLQLAINRAIAGTFLGATEFAVVNNVMSLTHRIQCWDFSKFNIPDISDPSVNVVVPHCKIHNDASVDISGDGRLLATLVPASVGLPSTTILGIYSLEKKTFACCLYMFCFGPNAISVSLSPLNRYILVGLASRRVTVGPSEKQVVAQIFRLLPEDGDDNLELVRSIEQSGDSRIHVSLNSIRWLPQPGQGIVYGTNRGDLRICRPVNFKETECPQPSKRNRSFPNRSSRRYSTQSTSTQTVAPQTHTAETQTGSDINL